MEKIVYFGYGTNRDRAMINAIVGRYPKGFNAKLENFELFIQPWSAIPKKAKNILKKEWKGDFRSYCIRPKEGKATFGMAWYLTKKERGLIGNWELHNIWYKPIKVNIKDKREKVFHAETEIVLDKKTKSNVSGGKYKAFINEKEKMLKVARKIREQS